MGRSSSRSRLGATVKRSRTRLAPESSDRSEKGASLILALVFIVVVAVIVGAISSLAINNLNNTTHFNSASALDYSASNVANLAIQSVRYNPQTVNGVAAACWTPSGGTLSEEQFNGLTVAIWCNSAIHPGSSQSRVVTMYACEDSSTGAPITEASCQSKPLLTLVEAYDDYSAAGTDTCALSPSNATCGFGASTLVWTWGSLANAVGGLILNTITVTTPIPTGAAVGGQYTPIATSTSGDPVTILPVDSTICSVSVGVVSFVASGTCTLNFTDEGNFNYAPAPIVSEQFRIG